MANLFDADNAPEKEPSEFVVGDFIQWKRTDLITDYPIATHSAEYVARISGGGSDEIKIAATESGGTYLFVADTATTTSYVAGHYHWQLEITQTSSGDRLVVNSGEWDVIVDLDVNATDPRIHAEIMVTKIESVLSGKADSDVSSYSINGRSLTKMSFSELTSARDYYQKEVAKHRKEEAVKRGQNHGATIKARF